MLTYGSPKEQVDPLKELVDCEIPDEIEVGETNDYWLWVNRSTRRLEFRSKENGDTIAVCEINADALKYGINVVQLKCAQQALDLKEST